MGSSQSTSNEIDSFINSVINVLNSTVQNCSTFANQNQNITITGGSGPVNISHIDYKEYAKVDVQCVQQAVLDSDTENNIKSLIDQTAKAVTQTLNLNIGSKSDVDNVTKLTTNLATEITNEFRQNCVLHLDQNQNITVKNHDGSIDIHYIHYDQSLKALNDCVQTAQAVTKAKNVIINKDSQKADNEQKSLLGDFIWIIILVLGVIAVVAIGGEKALLNPKVLMLFGIAVVAFIIYKVAQSKKNKGD